MKISILTMFLLLIGLKVFAGDVYIDGEGNISTGTLNSSGNLEVTSASGEDGIVSSASGTGAAGVYGENATTGNYGILGDSSYGVYGNSTTGYAGFFEGNARVTGNLTVDGITNITGFNADTLDSLDSTAFAPSSHNHDSSYVNENQANSITSSMIVDGTIQQGDLSFSLGDGFSLDSAGGSFTDVVYVNASGNTGIGTTAPAGKLDVNGDICLGGVCRTTWPSGSGTGAFTDTGSSAYYNGGSVGIGTSNPQGLAGTDSRMLHMVHPAAFLGDTTVGLRLEIDGIVDGGIMSAYNSGGSGGLFVGTISDHRLGLGTLGTEQMIFYSNSNVFLDGNFGIGTKTPLLPLHVQGSAYISDKLGVGVDSPTNNLQVNGSNTLLSSGTGDFRLYVSKHSQTDKASLIFQNNFTSHAELGLTGDDDFHIKVSEDGTTFTDALIINKNGNVGIGEQGSGAKFKVLKTTPYSYAIYAESLGDNSNAIGVEKDGSGSAVYIRKLPGKSGSSVEIDHLGSDPALVIKSGNFTTMKEILVVESTGNVAIGTANATAKLDLSGSTGYNQLRIRTTYTPTGTNDTNGNIGDIAWDDNYLYLKTNVGWKRTQLNTW